MHITRSKELTVRMGDYESFKFKAEVSASHFDLGFTNDDLTDENQADITSRLSDLVNAQLDNELQTDITDALEMGQDRNSFVQRAFGRTPLTTKSTRTMTRKR